MREEEREVWITDRPVTEGPGTYNVVGIAKGRSAVHHIATADRDEAMRIVEMRRSLEELRDMMGPKGRESFVALGPRMFLTVLQVVERALK
jgi:hypothetical protein